MLKEYTSKVYLEPIAHVYIHRETGVKYKSVTTAIKLIEPEFDADGIAEAITHQPDKVKQERYIGMSKNQILDFWQELNDIACAYGSRVHDNLEKYLKAGKWYFQADELDKKVIAGYTNLKIDEGIRMYPERILFSAHHQIAGMSDLVIDI